VGFVDDLAVIAEGGAYDTDRVLAVGLYLEMEAWLLWLEYGMAQIMPL